MKPLQDVTPTPEQLAILSRILPIVELITGAASSGKTTTALLRLRSLVGVFLNRRHREADNSPIRALVLTYNRTLRGYINELAASHTSDRSGVELTVSTFGSWARKALNQPRLVDAEARKSSLLRLASGLNLPSDFILDEVEYVMGRFMPESLSDYISTRRVGRGPSPRMDRQLRRQLMDQVILPYQYEIDHDEIWDWNDLAVRMAKDELLDPYDIVIVDESQDFSANQIRAISKHTAAVSAVTFVMDSAQQIYPRGFTWADAGISLRPENSFKLAKNYRNTIEIAEFAQPILEGVPLDDYASIPDLNTCVRTGDKPIVVRGRYTEQAEFAINYLTANVDLSTESVVFLHPLGWFRTLRPLLKAHSLPFVDITRRSDWPKGDENIALSTIHSAKGLEFDHVMLIGLNSEVMHEAESADDDRYLNHRRLLAMAICRARSTVILGYKPEDAPSIVEFLNPGSFEDIEL